jgi:hypothetical protein
VLLPLLAGCETTAWRPVEVRIPVPVPCIAALPDRPATTPDDALKAMSDYRLVLTLAADRAALRGHVEELRALLAPCTESPGKAIP